MFYGFSCDFERTEKYLTLEGKIKKTENKDDKKAERKQLEAQLKLLKPWEALEDLALKGAQDTMAYQYINGYRTADDIALRRKFLELSD